MSEYFAENKEKAAYEAKRAVAGPASAKDPYAGRPLALPADVAGRVRGAFGLEPARIQLRESGEVRRQGLAAAAQGDVIRFAPGVFRPNSGEGRQILGHELAHLRQQALGRVKPDTPGGPISTNAAHTAPLQGWPWGKKAKAKKRAKKAEKAERANRARYAKSLDLMRRNHEKDRRKRSLNFMRKKDAKDVFPQFAQVMAERYKNVKIDHTKPHSVQFNDLMMAGGMRGSDKETAGYRNHMGSLIDLGRNQAYLANLKHNKLKPLGEELGGKSLTDGALDDNAKYQAYSQENMDNVFDEIGKTLDDEGAMKSFGHAARAFRGATKGRMPHDYFGDDDTVSTTILGSYALNGLMGERTSMSSSLDYEDEKTNDTTNTLARLIQGQSMTAISAFNDVLNEVGYDLDPEKYKNTFEDLAPKKEGNHTITFENFKKYRALALRLRAGIKEDKSVKPVTLGKQQMFPWTQKQTKGSETNSIPVWDNKSDNYEQRPMVEALDMMGLLEDVDSQEDTES